LNFFEENNLTAVITLLSSSPCLHCRGQTPALILKQAIKAAGGVATYRLAHDSLLRREAPMNSSDRPLNTWISRWGITSFRE